MCMWSYVCVCDVHVELCVCVCDVHVNLCVCGV